MSTASMSSSKPIVSAEWVYAQLKDPDVILLDASVESTVGGKTSVHHNTTIPLARAFDLKSVFVDTESEFPNTVPRPERFEAACQALGINQHSKLVIFDNLGVYSSARAWWLFQVMGHENVVVLDGGLPQWIASGYPTEARLISFYERGNFKASYQEELCVLFPQVQENSQQPKFMVVDARSEGRFKGISEEPRKNLQSGHIPHSVNLPYQQVLENGRFKDKEALQELFSECCGEEQDLVFSCGSGMTACIIMLAHQVAGGVSKKVYDGSWTEWASLRGLTND